MFSIILFRKSICYGYILFIGEYLQNHCRGDDPYCEPCVDRLPSCIGFSDGDNPIMLLLWTQAFMKCLDNRTLGVESCQEGIFNPYLRECVEGKESLNFGEKGLISMKGQS